MEPQGNSWRRSSFCSSHTCIEAGWRRSSFCAASECIDACRDHGGWILIRSSNGGDVVAASPDEWAAFIAGVKAGEFDDLAQA